VVSRSSRKLYLSALCTAACIQKRLHVCASFIQGSTVRPGNVHVSNIRVNSRTAYKWQVCIHCTPYHDISVDPLRIVLLPTTSATHAVTRAGAASRLLALVLRCRTQSGSVSGSAARPNHASAHSSSVPRRVRMLTTRRRGEVDALGTHSATRPVLFTARVSGM
jgi:hypothetical protein